MEGNIRHAHTDPGQKKLGILLGFSQHSRVAVTGVNCMAPLPLERDTNSCSTFESYMTSILRNTSVPGSRHVAQKNNKKV